MNCNNLTPDEAIDLYHSSLPIDLDKRILEIRRGTFFVNDYMTTKSNSYVKGQFRGFLKGGGWVIYIGDETNIYWSISQYLNTHDWAVWKNFSRTKDYHNSFSVGPIFDITDLICKGWKGQFINWRTNPFEVKG
tara:strand:- start:5523 stop:5924 length:402 start_codon:yes stop_codon:yes gene_type:complete